ncbi:MOSC domain-containing protein [Planctomycetota bacterium]
MKLLSVNIGQPREIRFGDRVVQTAIVKSPIDAVDAEVTPLGIDGDTQVDQENHGGIHQAVYAYFEDSYRYWQTELNRDDLTPGTFGENLTISGMTEETVCIGDVFDIGDVRLQVSQPRQPCFKLGLVMGDQRFVERFLASQRLGTYFRVLRPGRIPFQAEISKTATGPGEISLSDVCRLRYFDKHDLAGAARCASLPDLSPEWRATFEARIRGTEFDA